jgi:hypothetical protein
MLLQYMANIAALKIAPIVRLSGLAAPQRAVVAACMTQGSSTPCASLACNSAGTLTFVAYLAVGWCQPFLCCCCVVLLLRPCAAVFAAACHWPQHSAAVAVALLLLPLLPLLLLVPGQFRQHQQEE